MMKYGNRKTTVDGVTFDSLAESRRYQELQIMQRAGLISRLTCQPEWELIPAYKRKDGTKVRATKYRADFSYTDCVTKEFIVEDVKGKATEVYKIKRKLFEYMFTDMTFVEVKA